MTYDSLNRRRSGFMLGATASLAAVVACSSSGSSGGASGSGSGSAASPDAAGSGGDGGDSGSTGASGSSGTPTNTPTEAGAVSQTPGACPSPTVSIVFSPMYSAFIPGSTAQVFSIPAVTADGTAATWSLSDPTQANLQIEAFAVNGGSIPGVLITMAGTGNDAGQVSVVATEPDGSCGISVLTITQNTAADWKIGNARYNDGVALHTPTRGARPDGGGGPPNGGAGASDGGDGQDGAADAGDATLALDAAAFQGFDGGGGMGFNSADAGSYFESEGGTACTNCHGPTATAGPYKTVSHTPEQTGGFSDMDLQNIIWNGVIPDGGYFDPTVVIATCDGGAACTAQALTRWHNFHRWTDITADELPGVICYLRSLTPEAQTGQSNFGGGARGGDGGGGGGRRDGGAGGMGPGAGEAGPGAGMGEAGLGAGTDEAGAEAGEAGTP